jgi:hypothetical protein
VDLVGQAVRVFPDQPSRIIAICFAHTARICFAQTDMAQPRVNIGN